MKRLRFATGVVSAFIVPVVIFSTSFAAAPVLKNPNDQGIGMQGRIQQPPPSQAPTISLPADNTHYKEIPVTVTGLCVTDLLVRLFKNSVFAGSAICANNSYTIQIDLFPGQNELAAKQYDDLDQASPESNKINLFYDIDEPLIPGSPDQVAERVTLTTTLARLGADPGTAMVWPMTLSGGTGPYALSIDWGDGKTELQSQASAGNFNIKHTYDKSGVYKIIVKATDKNGQSAFLQVVGIANGKISATAAAGSGTGPTITKTKVLWQPAAVCIPLLLTTFWLGKRYQLKKIRYRMKNRILPIDR